MRISRELVPSIYALTSPLPGHAPAATAHRLAAAGVRWIQIREKQSDDRTTLSIVREAAAAMPEGVSIFVNDRVDLALAGNASGVHLGDRDLPAADARTICGARLLIGVSTHSVEEALQAAADDEVDYIALGPIFQSPTKNVRSPLGVEPIRALRGATDRPIIAIGGISVGNIRDVLDAGADSAAIISALYLNDDIEENVRRLFEAAGRS